MIAGLLDLYESGGGLTWLLWALELQDTLDELFWDTSGSGVPRGGGAFAGVRLTSKAWYAAVLAEQLCVRKVVSCTKWDVELQAQWMICSGSTDSTGFWRCPRGGVIEMGVQEGIVGGFARHVLMFYCLQIR